jgi:hypothetical protein
MNGINTVFGYTEWSIITLSAAAVHHSCLCDESAAHPLQPIHPTSTHQKTLFAPVDISLLYIHLRYPLK